LLLMLPVMKTLQNSLTFIHNNNSNIS